MMRRRCGFEFKVLGVSAAEAGWGEGRYRFSLEAALPAIPGRRRRAVAPSESHRPRPDLEYVRWEHPMYRSVRKDIKLPRR